MALQQITASVQNDGNFNQLDLKDLAINGPRFRIETFRCSQPSGEFGRTLAGTEARHMTGLDHLSAYSNRIFRHVFSEERGSEQVVTLEIRESFDSAGAWEVRVRDLDASSETFGVTAVAAVTREGGQLRLCTDIRSSAVQPVSVHSPLESRVTELVPGLADIGAPVEELGPRHPNITPLDVMLSLHNGDEYRTKLDQFARQVTSGPFVSWAKNYRTYERFGDFRDKCIHPGINLAGPKAQLASEFIPIRAYRCSLIVWGRFFDPQMARGGDSLWTEALPLEYDTKPGVYTLFLSAYVLNIPLYQLGIDKVHSDYGGIPMALAPGSRLENGRSPVADATLANRTLADLAVIFYQPQLKPLVSSIRQNELIET